MTGRSNTRICARCDEPMTLGKRACQECGCTEWDWNATERMVIGTQRRST